MSAVIAIRAEVQLPAATPKTAWDLAKPEARECAMGRGVFARRIRQKVAEGSSVRQAVESVHLEARCGDLDHVVRGLGRIPSKRSLLRWFDDHRTGGAEALLPDYKGRVRQDYGWELRAQALYAQPTSRLYATVAFKLRQEGHTSATESRVRRYLKSLPAHLADKNPKRLGKHFHAQNVKPYVVRDASVVPPGHIYEADGHCCDVYVAHPVTGRTFRPELTVWIDIGSRYVVGWWLSESESAQTTMFSLSHALRAHDHVPAFAHLDPGPGFKARVIADDVTGFLARLSIQPIFTLPGNARGKGLVEGWFRWFEERCGKDFETYCGADRTDDALRRMQTRIRRGELRLPSFAEYLDAVKTYIAAYNASPNAGLEGRAPAVLWAELERTPLGELAAGLLRPRETCSVRSWRVRLHNRIYQAGSELQAYEGREVQVEYCLHDDSRVWVRDTKGRLVAEALLVEKKPWLPASRIEEGQRRRLEGQRKRLQAHADEAAARSRAPLMPAAVLDALEGEPAPALPTAAQRAIAQGHSVVAPPPVQIRTAPKPVSAELAARVRAEFAEEAGAIPADAHARFRLWRELQAAAARGEPADLELAAWAAAYATHPECEGFRLAFEDLTPELT